MDSKLEEIQEAIDESDWELALTLIAELRTLVEHAQEVGNT